jgi:hypothetical protein
MECGYSCGRQYYFFVVLFRAQPSNMIDGVSLTPPWPLFETDWWLSLWVAQDSKTTTLGVGRDHTQRFYAGGYVIWVAVTSLAVLMRTHVYQVMCRHVMMVRAQLRHRGVTVCH